MLDVVTCIPELLESRRLISRGVQAHLCCGGGQDLAISQQHFPDVKGWGFTPRPRGDCTVDAVNFQVLQTLKYEDLKLPDNHMVFSNQT